MKSRISALMFLATLFAGCRARFRRRVLRHDRGLQEARAKAPSSSRTAMPTLVFPTVGKGGLGVGAAHGSGQPTSRAYTLAM